MGDLLKRIVVGIKNVFWGVAVPDISEALSPASPAIREDIANAVGGFTDVILAPIQAKMDELGATHSPMTPDESVKWASAFAGVGAVGFGLGAAGSTISEFFTIGQVESISEWLRSFWVQAGFAGMLGTPIATLYNAGIRIPFNYWALAKFQPNIPGISDQVRFAVREAYPGVAIAAIPEEMRKWIRYLGYSKFWADAYWNAHWLIPTLEQARDLYWRGEIDVEEYKRMLRLSDYSPDFLDMWLELAWHYPGRIAARWMFEWNFITREELKRFIAAEGIHPDWQGKVTDAYAKNILRDEIGRVRTQLITHYREGFLDRSSLETELLKLGFRSEVVDMSLHEADLRVELEDKAEWYRVYEKQFTKGDITEEAFISNLTALGMTVEAINRKLAIAKTKLKVVK